MLRRAGRDFGFLVRNRFELVHGEALHIEQQRPGRLRQLLFDLRQVVVMAAFFLARQARLNFHLAIAFGKRIEEDIAGLQIVDIGILGGVFRRVAGNRALFLKPLATGGF